MEIKTRKLNPTDINDFLDLITVFKEVFEWKDIILPGTKHQQGLLNNSNFLVFVATADKKIVGGLTVYVLDKYDTEKPSAYIYDLAVVTNLQRKGIGKLLIKAVNDYCRKNGFHEVFVQAETDDIQAVNFYRTTPISSELKATHFIYSFDNN